MSLADDELEALWRAVFGEPPPISADPGLLAELIVRFLPRAPAYDKFAPSLGRPNPAPSKIRP
jgi:hypothetical protein